MKRSLQLFIVNLTIFCFFYLPGTYSQSNYILLPTETSWTFEENGQQFSYLPIDSVIVSIGFQSYTNGEYIMDMTIDNQSADTLFFDPESVYLFRYNGDSLLEKKLYHVINPEKVLDSISESYEYQETRIEKNIFLSFLAGVAYITAEIAGLSGKIDYDAMEAIRFGHSLVQAGLEHIRYDAENNIYNLDFAGDYWTKGAIRKTTIRPYSFQSGKIHFRVPYSELIKIYMPVENNLYHFTFECIEK
jgi:hypothetical protein